MSSGKRTTPGAAEGARRRRRPAPTIDLKATEIKAEPDAQTPPRESRERTPPGSGAHARAAGATASPASVGAADWFKSNFTLRTIAAALIGGMVAALTLMALLLTGTMPVNMAGGDGISNGRIAALETQLRELANRPKTAPAASPDNKTITALTQRIAKLEQSIAARPAADPSASARMTAIEQKIESADNAMKSLGIALTALTRRTDDTAGNIAEARNRADAAANAVTELKNTLQDSVKQAADEAARAAARNVAPAVQAKDLAALQARMGELENAAKTAREQAAEATGPDVPARLALSAALLRDAVIRGEPFSRELAAVKSLGADSAALVPLAPFAESGVPREQALARELSGLLPAMLKAAEIKPSGEAGFLERLQANAGNLVRIRPLDAPPGDDPESTLARIEVAAARGDIATASAELGKLPEKIRAPAAGWIEKTKGRAAALEASRALAADAARALGRP